MADNPSPEAFAFLKRVSGIHRKQRFMFARILDEFHAERMKADEDANREALAQNIKNWVERLQPSDLRNRSTAELQDELQRRAYAACEADKTRHRLG